MSAFLELQGVTKRYPGSDQEVLRSVELSVGRGETVAIAGPSGSGKSTLLNIIGTLDHPSSGTVTLDGENVHMLSEVGAAALRNERIGFVFQLHHLLPQCTALENVLVPALVRGDMRSAESRGRELLERVGLSHRLDYRPGRLSGGERQRVAVARALVNEPELVLADEPTGSLDRETSDSVGELLTALNKELGFSIVTVTHSERLAKRMGRVLELRDGMLGGDIGV